MFEWDEKKRAANIAKHSIDFDMVWELDWTTAMQNIDGRKEYAEVRWVALVFKGERLFSCVFTFRGDTRRIISLRKANSREMGIYEKRKKLDY